MQCSHCEKDLPEGRTLCCECCKRIRERGFNFLNEHCDLLGKIGTATASLEILIRDKFFVDGYLRVDDLSEVGVDGLLYDDGSLELDLADSIIDDWSHGRGYPIPTRTVPALAGIFDRRTFAGDVKIAHRPDVITNFTFIVTRLVATRPAARPGGQTRGDTK